MSLVAEHRHLACHSIHSWPDSSCTCAELDKQTALLPAVLQSSDSTSLVDHLATVFNEADWKCTARQAWDHAQARQSFVVAFPIVTLTSITCRCSGFVDNAAPSEPSGWEAFQEVLRGQPQQTQARSDIQAMDTALLRLQADIQSIEQTTCLPPSRLATLTASSSDGAGHLQAVRCTVCHSLLLAAAFNDHLPRCRPCIPQPAVPSNSSHPSSSGRQGSRLGSGRGRLAAKKGKGRGSKKPPAGPSRFAIEQAKPPPQQQPTPRPPSDLHHQLLAHPSQQQQRRLHQHQPMVHEAAAPVQVTDMFRPAHAVGLTCSSTVPGGEVPASQMQTAGQRHSSQAEAKREAAPQARQAKRSRSAWTYEEHLCRNNPDLDAVHDPMLPPRFPQNVTGKRSRKRSVLSHHCFLSNQP